MMTTKTKPPDGNGKGDDRTTLIVCGIPEELKTRFKLHCVRNGLSMSEVLVRFIERFVRKEAAE